MKREDWHFHLIIFLGSLLVCIIGYSKAIGAAQSSDVAIAIGGLTHAIVGSALFIVGACGILLQYFLNIKYVNKDGSE
ncbi:hypothetical protein KHQ81_01105 [Mycoplasmatota bacterium]|nr:hypothetical protein KHQ81_01105 [Mycoplasmatota bacterium]